MQATISEILTVRRALVRAHLSAERHLAFAKTKELKRLYEDDCQAIAKAMRVVEGTASELSINERQRIDEMLRSMNAEAEVKQ